MLFWRGGETREVSGADDSCGRFAAAHASIGKCLKDKDWRKKAPLVQLERGHYRFQRRLEDQLQSQLYFPRVMSGGHSREGGADVFELRVARV